MISNKLLIFGFVFIFVALFSISSFMAKSVNSAGNTFYVSKTGNNSDGKTWATAWNELNQINWSVISPGDTILLDGGSTKMTYTSTLTLGRSGTSSSPILIQLATEAGRNGQVEIFGGRSTPLPYCGQGSYTYQTSGVNRDGIVTGTNSWVVIDGGKWSGITVHGNSNDGVRLNGGSSNITVRNVEIYDNGNASQTSNGWEPDRPGIDISGSNNTVERAIIHDNGQDAMQSGGGLSNFIIRNSWVYNGRRTPSGAIWNQCTHSDGIQVYGGYEQSGVTIDGSVFGPGFMQGTILGQSAYTDGTGTTRWAVLDNVTVHNSLFYGSSNCNICDYASTPVKPKNWVISNVTSDRGTGSTWHNTMFNGDASQLTISNSILDGGYDETVPSGGIYTGNVEYNLGGTRVGMVADPMYINSSVHGSILTSADFTLASNSPAIGKGSSITSSSSLLNQSGLIQLSPTPTTSPTATPTPLTTINHTPNLNAQSSNRKNGNIRTILEHVFSFMRLNWR